MSHGAELDALVERLKWEASTTMPRTKFFEFEQFVDRLRARQRTLPFGASQTEAAKA